MNKLALLLAILAGGFGAAWAVRLLRRRKPEWSPAKRVTAAVLLLPALLALLAALGVVWAYATLPNGGERGSGITSFLLILIATVLGVASLIGGLIGGIMAERRAP